MIKQKEQSFKDWVYNPTHDDELIANTFRRTVKYAFDHKLQINHMDVSAPSPESIEWKLAILLYHKKITPEGNKVYVYRNGDLTPLPDGMEDLQYLLHESEKNTAKAYGILVHNFKGVCRNLVEKDTIGILEQDSLLKDSEPKHTRINLKTMELIEGKDPHTIPELGWHSYDPDRTAVVLKFFSEQNRAFGTEDEFFFEKAISYPFHQRFREKAFICNGPGGMGKTLMTELAGKLYGSKGVVASEPTFTGQDKNRITKQFIGKKWISYVDIQEPSPQLMTWLKPMTTGNMTIKGEGGYERSVPCEAVFYLETNFKPQFLGGNQDVRRFVVRQPEINDYKLVEHLTQDELDVLGQEVTAADIAVHLFLMSQAINDWAGGWCHFEERPLPIADFIEIAQEFFENYPGKATKASVTAYATQNKLSKIELETLKEVLIVDEKKQLEKTEGSRSADEELRQEDSLPEPEESGTGSDVDDETGQAGDPLLLSEMQELASDESEELDKKMQEWIDNPLEVWCPDETF